MAVHCLKFGYVKFYIPNDQEISQVQNNFSRAVYGYNIGVKCYWYIDIGVIRYWYIDIDVKCYWHIDIGVIWYWYIEIGVRYHWFIDIGAKCYWYVDIGVKCYWYIDIGVRGHLLIFIVFQRMDLEGNWCTTRLPLQKQSHHRHHHHLHHQDHQPVLVKVSEQADVWCLPYSDKYLLCLAPSIKWSSV